MNLGETPLSPPLDIESLPSEGRCFRGHSVQDVAVWHKSSLLGVADQPGLTTDRTRLHRRKWQAMLRRGQLVKVPIGQSRSLKPTMSSL